MMRGFLLAILVASGADAAVIFSTLDANGGFHPTAWSGAATLFVQEGAWGTGFSRCAVGFTVTGGAFRLESISLPIGQWGTPEDILRVSLAEDSEGVPGNTIEVLSDRQPWPESTSPFSTLTTLYSGAHPPLLEGSRFWIVAEIAFIPRTGYVQTRYEWYQNLSNSAVPFWWQSQNDQYPRLPYSPWDWDNYDTYFTSQPVAFRVEGTQAVGVEPRRFVTRLASARPTPFQGRTSLDYEIARRGPVEIAVFSVTGARVRTLVSGDHAAGPDHATWDGRDERGQIAPTGMYIVRMESAGIRIHQRLIKLD
jgi:hypothetical protein